jgi:hypothetical protein
MIFIHIPNPSGRIGPCDLLFLTEISSRDRKKVSGVLSEAYA